MKGNLERRKERQLDMYISVSSQFTNAFREPHTVCKAPGTLNYGRYRYHKSER